MNGVIETSTGNLLRAGFSIFIASEEETLRSDAPQPSFVKSDTSNNQMHNWNGSAWTLVDKPVPQEILITGNGNIELELTNDDINQKQVTITGDTMISICNCLSPKNLLLIIKQDAIGGHVLTFDRDYFDIKMAGIVLTTTANSIDTFIFSYIADKFILHSFTQDVI